jgi:predicted PurR-regulated permease PerM
MDLKSDSTSQVLPEKKSSVQDEENGRHDTHPANLSRRKVAKQNRYFIAAVFIGLLILALPMIKIFAIPLLLATTMVILLHPLYKLLHKILWKNKTFSALACCLIIGFCALIPAYLFGYVVTRQAIDLYSSAEPKLREIAHKAEEGKLHTIATSRYMRWARIAKIDWDASLQEAMKKAATVVTNVVNKTSASIVGLLLNLLITLFAMFYLFIDGEAFVHKLKHLIPLRHEYKELIFSRFLQVSRATVKATLVIGLVQGTLGGLTLLIFGIKTWLLWGFVMVILSLLPVVGAWSVLVPAAIIQIILGNIWQGIGILVISTVFIANVDSFIRPRLVGHEAKMHDLVVFVSSIGGIYAFGVMGFIVGPVIAAAFVSIIDIYNTEFKEYLDEE